MSMKKNISKALAMAVMMSVFAGGSAYAANGVFLLDHKDLNEETTNHPGIYVTTNERRVYILENEIIFTANSHEAIRLNVASGLNLFSKDISGAKDITASGTITAGTSGAIKSGETALVNGGAVYTALEGKVDAADVYTKSDVDTKLDAKANAADVYTKSDVDTKLDAKANAADVYTKSDVDTGLAKKVDAGTATGTSALAVGQTSEAKSHYSTAVGAYSTAEFSGTAVGYYAKATGDNSTAIGNDAKASNDKATALGMSASATGENSVALGSMSQAQGENSVALGYNSIAREDNVVSVGAEGSERKIVNVAEGTNDTDAVNKGQLDKKADKADVEKNATDIADHETRISTLETSGASTAALEKLDSKINQTDARLNRVGATAAALAAINYQPMAKGQSQVAIGMGGYNGKKATAIGLAYQFDNRISGSVAGAANGSEHMFNVGFNYLFGQHTAKDIAPMAASNSVSLKEAELQATVDTQNAKINNLEAEVAELKAMVKALAAK